MQSKGTFSLDICLYCNFIKGLKEPHLVPARQQDRDSGNRVFAWPFFSERGNYGTSEYQWRVLIFPQTVDFHCDMMVFTLHSNRVAQPHTPRPGYPCDSSIQHSMLNHCLRLLHPSHVTSTTLVSINKQPVPRPFSSKPCSHPQYSPRPSPSLYPHDHPPRDSREPPPPSAHTPARDTHH